MKYYLMHVKKAFQTFVKNGVYWVDENNASVVPPSFATMYPSTIIKKYTNQPYLLLVRSAGIGDIIALSSLCGIADNTILVSQWKYNVLMDYFEYPPRLRPFNEPIFMVSFPDTVESLCAKIGMMYGDEQIEQGSKRNWYEILHESTNNIFGDFTQHDGIPSLKSLTKQGNDKCIIVNSASNVNRSMDKEMIRRVASKHFTNIVFADEQQWTLKQYLNELDMAGFVISVDTSAIHFREGIKKPAFGIYASFTTESRTKYYTNTKSIDVKSPCELQPCFRHDGQHCPFIPKGAPSAPCLSSYGNPTAEQQIDIALTEYLKTLNT